MDLIHELCPAQLLEVTKKSDGLIDQHTAFGSYVWMKLLRAFRTKFVSFRVKVRFIKPDFGCCCELSESTKLYIIRNIDLHE